MQGDRRKPRDRDTERIYDTEPDQLYMWNSISFSDIKGIPRLKFEIIKRGKFKGRQSLPKVTIDDKRNVTVITRCSDNAYLDLGEILQKLTTLLSESSVEKISLAKDDMIFEYVDEKELIETYNSMQNKWRGRQTPTRILLYNPPIKVQDKEEQMKIIKEYHDSPQGGYAGVKTTIIRIKQKYLWKHMNKMIRDYIKQCIS